MAEDAGGYFCSVCGKDLHNGECEELIYETDIYWDVAIRTLIDSLEQEEKADEQLCTFNKETRKRVMEQIIKWRKQASQRYRLDAYHRSGYTLGG